MRHRSADYWLSEAARVLADAEKLGDPRSRVVLLEIALLYQGLAKAARADGRTYISEAGHDSSPDRRSS